MAKKDRFTRQELSWIFYDWANSSHSTIIVAAILPIYFVSVATKAGASGDYWWGVATSVSTLVMALLAPFLGSIGDYKGMKKKLFSIFLGIGLAATATIVFSNRWEFLLIGYMFSYAGFMGANLFYDSFLTDVTTADRMDRVSTYGYGLGYIGGSTIPFLFAIGIIMTGKYIGIDSVLAAKIAIAIVVFWWGLFSIPILRNVKQTHYEERPAHLFAGTFGRIGRTFLGIVSNKGIRVFVLAYFFYIDGVNTVINMATAYGATLGLDSTGMILALMVTQLVAFPCAILFGRMSKRFGTVAMIGYAIGVYFLICTVGFVMGFLPIAVSQVLFWIVAVLVGSVQGGIQALSRSFFGKIIPAEKSNEYFGFFDIFGKFAAVLGPALYAFLRGVTGNPAYGILGIMALFLVSGIIVVVGRKPLHEMEIHATNQVDAAIQKKVDDAANGA